MDRGFAGSAGAHAATLVRDATDRLSRPAAAGCGASCAIAAADDGSTIM
jgi:hypothetical protein